MLGVSLSLCRSSSPPGGGLKRTSQLAAKCVCDLRHRSQRKVSIAPEDLANISGLHADPARQLTPGDRGTAHGRDHIICELERGSLCLVPLSLSRVSKRCLYLLMDLFNFLHRSAMIATLTYRLMSSSQVENWGGSKEINL